MSGEAKEAGAAIFSGVRSVAHIFGDFGDISSEDEVAIEFDANVGAIDGDFLEVPCASGSEEAAFGCGDAIDGAVVLAGVKFGVVGVFGVEDLEFAHGVVGGVAFTIGADSESIVTGGRGEEFEADGEVCVFFGGMEDAAFAFAAANGAIDNFVVVGGAGPAGEIFAVEDGFEVSVVALGEDLIGFFGGDFTDVDVSPADFATVCLEADWAFEEEGILAIPVVFHDGVIDDMLSVEPDGGAGTDLSDAEAVPFAEGFISADGGVFAGGAGAVIPETATAFVGTEFEFGFFGVVPDLNLG